MATTESGRNYYLPQNKSGLSTAMDEFARLLAEDPQLQFASNAFRHYRKVAVPEFIEKDSHDKSRSHKSTINSGGAIISLGTALNNKRHIVNVDDVSRINYEMIKNSPGNLLASGRGQEKPIEHEVDNIKTKLYKNSLCEMNNAYLASIEKKILKKNRIKNKNKGSSTELPQAEQFKLLSQIHKNMIKEYKKLVQKEKQWFTLKELLLDANAELDLFSSNGDDRNEPTVELGGKETTASISPKSKLLLFNRRPQKRVLKRQK